MGMTFTPDADPEVTSVDGLAYIINASLAWADILTAAGTNGRDDDGNNVAVGFTSDIIADKWDVLVRSLYLFDITALPATATIISWTLSLYGNAKQDLLVVTPDINIYDVTPASNTAVVPADYNNFGNTPYCDTPITYANWLVDAWNNFNSNAAGLAHVQAAFAGDKIVKIGARNANYDAGAVAPVWVSNKNSSLSVYYADGDPSDVPGCSPKLSINYSVPGVYGTDVITLEALRNIEMSARGRFFADEQGRATYKNRFARN